MFLGPREAMEIQALLGSDIAMVFDECPPYPCDYEYAARSLDRTVAWARVCKEAGIPGLISASSRGRPFPSCGVLPRKRWSPLDFDGYAIGGVSVGEPEAEMMAAIESSEPILPENKPRYAMGLGTPPQLSS